MVIMCHSCGQTLDEHLFMHGTICDYCWAMLGKEHHFSKEDVTVFGEIPAAGSSDKWNE
jgi:hypothetical protein